MNKSTSPWIAQVHFDTAKTSTWVSPIANLILFICYLFFLTTDVFSDSHAVFCIVSAAILFVLCLRYSWKNPEANLFIVILYILSVVAEYYFIGMASNPLGYSDMYMMSKGIALEMGVDLLPAIYFVIKILAAVPLLLVYFKAKRLEKVVSRSME